MPSHKQILNLDQTAIRFRIGITDGERMQYVQISRHNELGPKDTAQVLEWDGTGYWGFGDNAQYWIKYHMERLDEETLFLELVD
jgi:hypothetical protein